MQSSPASMAFRPVATRKGQPNPRFGNQTRPVKTSPEASQQNSSSPIQVDELTTAPPVSSIDEQAMETTIQRQMEAHQKAAEGIMTGLKKGFDVLAHQRDWRKQFSDSNQKENFLEQLSSVWELTVARFREGFPKKDEDHFRQTLENPEAVEAKITETKPELQTDKPADSSSSVNNADPSKESTPEKGAPNNENDHTHHENPDAFKRYAKVITKYPELALLNEKHLPFDLGTQAALASPKPDTLLKKLGTERNRLAQLQQRMRQHVESNKLNRDQAQTYASTIMQKELPALREAVKLIFNSQ